MIALLMLATVTADLDALEVAVTRCERQAVNPVLAGEAARRSQFLLDVYRAQAAIVSDRQALAEQRRQLREAPTGSSAEQRELGRQLDLQQAALGDRQQALSDRRMLESIRQDTVDSMRRRFLINCPAGGEKN